MENEKLHVALVGVAVSVALCATSNDVEDPRRPHCGEVMVSASSWQQGELLNGGDGGQWRTVERGRV